MKPKLGLFALLCLNLRGVWRRSFELTQVWKGCVCLSVSRVELRRSSLVVKLMERIHHCRKKSPLSTSSVKTFFPEHVHINRLTFSGCVTLGVYLYSPRDLSSALGVGGIRYLFCIIPRNTNPSLKRDEKNIVRFCSHLINKKNKTNFTSPPLQRGSVWFPWESGCGIQPPTCAERFWHICARVDKCVA